MEFHRKEEDEGKHTYIKSKEGILEGKKLLRSFEILKTKKSWNSSE